jgi:hypothetical protein
MKIDGIKTPRSSTSSPRKNKTDTEHSDEKK